MLFTLGVVPMVSEHIVSEERYDAETRRHGDAGFSEGQIRSTRRHGDAGFSEGPIRSTRRHHASGVTGYDTGTRGFRKVQFARPGDITPLA
jgi:hypothetical protein